MTTQLQEPESTSPLEKCAEKFTQWRATRAHRRATVPVSLRQQALELLNDYRKSHIIKALGINNNMLKNWQGEDTGSPLRSSSPFIPLKTEVAASDLAFTLTYSQGATLHISGNFSLAQLTAFAQGLCPNSSQEVFPR